MGSMTSRKKPSARKLVLAIAIIVGVASGLTMYLRAAWVPAGSAVDLGQISSDALFDREPVKSESSCQLFLAQHPPLDLEHPLIAGSWACVRLRNGDWGAQKGFSIKRGPNAEDITVAVGAAVGTFLVLTLLAVSWRALGAMSRDRL